MPFVNQIAIAAISESEILPVSVTIEDLPGTGAHAIVSVERFKMGAAEVEPVNIAAHALISSRVFTLTNIWDDGETPEAGIYRVKVITQSEDESRRIEFNLFFEVVDS